MNKCTMKPDSTQCAADPLSWACPIQLNNHAASLLESGDYNEACVSLCRALHVTRSCKRSTEYSPTNTWTRSCGKTRSQEVQESECQGPSQRVHNSGHQTRKISQGKRVNSGLPLTSHECHQQEEEEEMNFIFRTPLRLSQGRDSISKVATTSAILYNIGLAQSLMAIESKVEVSPSRLIGALQMYEIVYALQEVDGSTEDQLPCLHLLGLINNCAHLHRLLKRPKKADRLLQHLLALLMLLVVEGDEEITGLEFFIAATSHLVLRQSCAARAA